MAPASSASDAQAAAILLNRCATCHSGAAAPAGLRLDDAANAAARADLVAAMVRTRAMPPGNATQMTNAEREALLAWLAAQG